MKRESLEQKYIQADKQIFADGNAPEAIEALSRGALTHSELSI
ncbi:MAG: hypothetical protein ACI3XF_02755 [Eubacteriales bacterium]